MTEQRFTAIVIKSQSRVVIALPFDADQEWGKKQRHHIIGSVNGHAIRGALGVQENQLCMILGDAWRRDTGVQPGDTVEVILSPEGPQAGQLPEDIEAALGQEPEARAFFESLATFYRGGYLRWIEGAKRPETRAARIAEMVGLLKAGKKQK